MYKLLEFEDIIRIPPALFNLPLKDAAIEVLRTSYEGRIIRGLGLAVSILDVNVDAKGIIIPGEGATYHKARVKALFFSPEPQEVVEGIVTVVAEYGIEVRLGPVDGFIHKSQIFEKETFSYSREQEYLLGEKTGKILRRGDVVRARIVQVSYGTRRLRLRIGLTMTQPYLGKLEWIKEAIEVKKGAKKKRSSS
ncbi:MAG TPA: DNA-directed RNA polymerase [Thermofilum sp.]|nr:DNA-directed RNA polymerase [Thermofilum sp.]